MSEAQLAKYRGKLFQLYSLSAVDIENRFRAKYGYQPETIIVTGGGIFAGPVVENDNDSECNDRPKGT